MLVDMIYAECVCFVAFLFTICLLLMSVAKVYKHTYLPIGIHNISVELWFEELTYKSKRTWSVLFVYVCMLFKTLS